MLRSAIRRACAVLAVFLSAFPLLIGSGWAASEESLADALVAAYRNSGLLEQNRALLRAADEDLAQAVAGLRPVLNYVLGAEYSSVTDTTRSNLNLTASLVLHDFGRSRLRRELARENVLSLREALLGVEQQVLLQAATAYAGMLREAAVLQLQQKSLELIGEELRAAKDRFELGQITRTDVALAEARLAASRSALEAARGALAVAREDYRAATGDYPGRLRALPALPALPASHAEAQAIARRNHPDLAQARRAVTIAELNASLAEAAFLPTLSGSASLTVDQDGNDASGIGVRLSGPLYQGGALAASARKAAAQRDAARAGLHLAASAVDQAVGSAWAGVSVAEARLAATDQQIRAARVALRGVRKERDLGTRTTLDVLNAEQALLDAQVARVSARTDRYLAVYNLLAAMGLLTVDHLNLGIVEYDPAAYYNAVRNAPLHRVSPQGRRLDSLLQSLGRN